MVASEYTQKYTMLSVIGNIVSCLSTGSSDGGAHPSNWAEYHTVELGKATLMVDPHVEVKLTSIFPEDLLFKALKATELIRDHLRNRRPANLSQLIHSLQDSCEVSFTSLLTSWCIYDIGKDSVTIRFGLGSGYEQCRGNFTEFDISLPIPAAHRAYFQEALKNGTFSKNSCGLR